MKLVSEGKDIDKPNYRKEADDEMVDRFPFQNITIRLHFSCRLRLSEKQKKTD